MAESDGDTGNEMLVDETICLVCGGSTFVGETISCETCLRWFHFNCVGVTHSDPCVQSEDVPYFCPSCDVQNRKAKKAKRQSLVKDQKAKIAAAEAASIRNKDLKLNAELKSDKTVASDGLVSVMNESTTYKPDGLGLSLESIGQNVIIADLEDSKKDFFGQGHTLDVGVPLLENSDEDSGHEQLVIDLQGKRKKSRKSEKGVVTQMVPQLELPLCLMEPQGAQEQTSEEEAWLDAVESGNLQKAVSCDSELRSLREPSLMTARQRALAAGGVETDGIEELEMLDFGTKPSKADKEMTEEDKAEKIVKALKRKEMESEKREKMKQKTMDTLLKKKDSKVTKQIKTLKTIKEDLPKISYVANSAGFTLSFPSGHEYPLSPSAPYKPPVPILCIMCDNRKKYNSSKTGDPVCSLACYKENLVRTAV